MKPLGIHLALAVAALALAGAPVASWTGDAAARLGERPDERTTAVASMTDKGYCDGALRPILRRVLTSCGLLKGGQSRGCKPVDAKKVAAMSGNDFNALFRPVAERAAIVQFDLDRSELDESGAALLDRTFSAQKGASYFLVVARASPEGAVQHNRELSERRAGAVLDHLRAQFKDPDLDQEVGLLWLGEEFAQLDREFCQWSRSHTDAECSTAELNRSAFVAWIDCRL